MLDSTIELFTTSVASNSLLAFGLCNLIIIILFLSGPKPSSSCTQESSISTHEAPIGTEKEEKIEDEGFTSEEIEASSSANLLQLSHATNSPSDELDIEAASSANILQLSNAINSPCNELDVNDCTEESDNEDECVEDIDDELRRRVEEFIEKVNRGWKAEKLMTLDLYRSTHMVI